MRKVLRKIRLQLSSGVVRVTPADQSIYGRFRAEAQLLEEMGAEEAGRPCEQHCPGRGCPLRGSDRLYLGIEDGIVHKCGRCRLLTRYVLKPGLLPQQAGQERSLLGDRQARKQVRSDSRVHRS